MAAVVLTEARLGPSAAGWVAALPVCLAVAEVAVMLDAGTRAAGAMALSAAMHVPAQVVFAVLFACVLRRWGVTAGAAAGGLGYVACSLGLSGLPGALIVPCAFPAVMLAPRAMAAGRPRAGSPRRPLEAALTCAVASVFVGAAVTVSRLAGPEMGGAVAAFPTMSTTLAVVVANRDGQLAGVHALTGLVRSLPCYLAFTLVIAVALPSFGVAAIALGVLACALIARPTRRRIPVVRQPVLAQ
jgi:hypothetical protein